MSNEQIKQKYKDTLKPLSRKNNFTYSFVGFDVETFGEKNDFYMGGLYWYTKSGREKFKEFFNKEDMIKEILSNKFIKNTYIVATNLHFDLTVLFFNTMYWNDLNVLYKNGDIIYASYEYNDCGKKRKIEFIDTTNYAFFSVEKQGEILGVPKLKHPDALGRIPQNKAEQDALVEYNKFDCKITCDFMYFLQRGITEAGGNLKITVASTAFDVWRRGFQPHIITKEKKILNNDSVRDFIFEGYYGGRTEVYKKGKFKNVYYYDVNSLYPSVMRNKYPFPDSVKYPEEYSEENISKYMGVTRCKVKCPNLNKPFLPYKSESGKLIFPQGEFIGTWNNCELERARELGYQIKEIYNQIIYTKSFYPFKEYVEYFYNARQQYKKQGSSMEIVYKLLLNSLYGKFGQKKITKTEITDLTNFEGGHDELMNLFTEDTVEKDGLLLSNKDEKYDGKNCYPILASYTTSYARILMYEYLKSEKVIYTDTDSVLSEDSLNVNSKELGEMKCEGSYEEAYFIKPKFYYIYDGQDYEVHIKGVPKPSIDDFYNILKGNTVYKKKFTKIKESIRRNLQVNEVQTMPKNMDLTDDKREWYSNGQIKLSKPLIL